MGTAGLEARKLVTRTFKAEDGWEMSLQLTRDGRRMVEALLPLALEREAALAFQPGVGGAPRVPRGIGRVALGEAGNP